MCNHLINFLLLLPLQQVRDGVPPSQGLPEVPKARIGGGGGTHAAHSVKLSHKFENTFFDIKGKSI